MRLHDTVLRMREHLTDARVDLIPEHADAEEVYEGPGKNAEQAWGAFCAIALEPAFDPVDVGEGKFEPVAHAGFQFTATFSEGFSARHGEPAVPEHFELMCSRAFSV